MNPPKLRFRHRALLLFAACLVASVSRLCANEPPRIELNNPPLAALYDEYVIETLDLHDDPIDRVLQKLTVAMTVRHPTERPIGVVLVKPSEELLHKRFSQQFQKRTLKQLLEHLCAEAGLHYALDYSAIRIGEKKVDISIKGIRSDTAIEEKADHMEVGRWIMIPKMELNGSEIAPVADEIFKQAVKYNATGKPISFESKLSAEQRKRKVYAWFPDVAVHEAIEYSCLSAGLRYSCSSDGHYVLLGSK